MGQLGAVGELVELGGVGGRAELGGRQHRGVVGGLGKWVGRERRRDERARGLWEIGRAHV